MQGSLRQRYDSRTVQSIISLTFDDGLRCQFESALPILNSHGMRATFFLIANRNPTHDLWSGHTHDWWKIQWRDDDVAMLRQLVQDGHEIGSHSVTHHPTEMPKQPALEACESKKLIEGWIGTRVSSFCYPFYRSHAFLADAVKDAGYEQARGGGTQPLYEPGASYYAISDAARFDRFNVDCRQISKNEDVAGWLRPGYWHVLTFHAFGGIPVRSKSLLSRKAQRACASRNAQLRTSATDTPSTQHPLELEP